MPRFLIAIHEHEAGYARDELDARTQLWRRHEEFIAALTALGAQVLRAEALGPQAASVHLCTDGPTPVLIDDPLPAASAQLGGFYLIDAPDLDTAVEAAAHCPARHGYVEVRPVVLPAS